MYKRQPLNDVKVRKAIQMAIDRQTILDTVYNGDGSLVDGIYPCLLYTSIGRLATTAIQNRDMPVLQGTVLFTTVLVIAGNLIADLLYSCLLYTSRCV